MLPNAVVLWDINLQPNIKVEKDNIILVYGKGWLYAISSIDGEVLWRNDFSTKR